MDHPIRRLCGAAEITQREVAEASGFSQAFISDLVNGKDRCGREAALRLWRVFGLDVLELLMWGQPADAYDEAHPSAQIGQNSPHRS